MKLFIGRDYDRLKRYRVLINALVIPFFVLTSPASLACGGGWSSEEDKVEILSLFDEVLSCREHKGQEAIQCVDAQMASETSDRLTMKITKWLLDVDSLGPAEVCPQRVSELFPEAGKSRYVAILCSSYVLNGKTDIALLYFVREEGVKLAGIQKVRF
ncbi:hypothetical protein [Alcanivorax sp.]|uniref:hypothetical protein n=1 Tax=Alcanivorax sp. TaxID=1872427 RepID=UPI002635099E|nr:hypothetical protein [Alcanivorax sp.]